MTNNPQQLQSQLVVEQDAAASWDSLREVSFFLVSMDGELQHVTNPHYENQFSPNVANTKAFTNHTLSHQWQYQQFSQLLYCVKTNSVLFIQNLADMQSFIRNHSKVIKFKVWNPKLANFLQTNVCWGGGVTLVPKYWQVLGPYFKEFAMDSHET